MWESQFFFQRCGHQVAIHVALDGPTPLTIQEALSGLIVFFFFLKLTGKSGELHREGIEG